MAAGAGCQGRGQRPETSKSGILPARGQVRRIDLEELFSKCGSLTSSFFDRHKSLGTQSVEKGESSKKTSEAIQGHTSDRNGCPLSVSFFNTRHVFSTFQFLL